MAAIMLAINRLRRFLGPIFEELMVIDGFL